MTRDQPCRRPTTWVEDTGLLTPAVTPCRGR